MKTPSATVTKKKKKKKSFFFFYSLGRSPLLCQRSPDDPIITYLFYYLPFLPGRSSTPGGRSYTSTHPSGCRRPSGCSGSGHWTNTESKQRRSGCGSCHIVNNMLPGASQVPAFQGYTDWSPRVWRVRMVLNVVTYHGGSGNGSLEHVRRRLG